MENPEPIFLEGLDHNITICSKEVKVRISSQSTIAKGTEPKITVNSDHYFIPGKEKLLQYTITTKEPMAITIKCPQIKDEEVIFSSVSCDKTLYVEGEKKIDALIKIMEKRPYNLPPLSIEFFAGGVKISKNSGIFQLFPKEEKGNFHIAPDLKKKGINIIYFNDIHRKINCTINGKEKTIDLYKGITFIPLNSNKGEVICEGKRINYNFEVPEENEKYKKFIFFIAFLIFIAIFLLARFKD